MRRFIIMAAMVWGGSAAHGETERRDLAGFDRVRLALAAELTLTQGEEEGVVIEADEGVIDRVRSRVSNRRLILDLEPSVLGWFDDSGHVAIHVTFRELRELDVAGSGDAECEAIASDDLALIIHGSGSIGVGDVRAERLDLRVSGSGRFDIDNLSVDEMSTAIDGSGQIQLGGAADVQRVEISGSGNFDADAVESAAVALAINGSGTAEVWVNEALDVELNGSGTVRYRGDGSVEREINGSGSVSKRGR